MQSGADREREELLKELRKRGKKEFLLPLMVLLRIPDPNRHRSESCAEIIASKLQEMIQHNRSSSGRDADVVNNVMYTISARASQNDPIVDEVRGILRKLYTKPQQFNQSNYTTYRPSSKLLNLKDSYKCLCSAAGTAPGAQLGQCSGCGKKFHRDCMQLKQTEFECPYCVLHKLDPLNSVMECLFLACLPKLDSYTLQFNSPSMISTNEALEVRCIRIDGINNNVQTWPDIGKITLNDSLLISFIPLATNVGLKKRKDPTVIINKPSIRFSNVLKVWADLPGYPKERFKITDSPHFIGIYKVKRLESIELFQQLKDHYAPHELSDRLLKLTISDEDVSIEGESISLVCSLSSSRIEVPARGKYCKHYRCFDLLTLIKLNYSSPNRKWECPHCRCHTYELMVDSRLKEIIDKDNRAIAVSFQRDGGFKLVYSNEDNSSDEDSNKPIKKKGKVQSETEVVLLDSEDSLQQLKQDTKLRTTLKKLAEEEERHVRQEQEQAISRKFQKWQNERRAEDVVDQDHDWERHDVRPADPIQSTSPAFDKDERNDINQNDEEVRPHLSDSSSPQLRQEEEKEENLDIILPPVNVERPISSREPVVSKQLYRPTYSENRLEDEPFRTFKPNSTVQSIQPKTNDLSGKASAPMPSMAEKEIVTIEIDSDSDHQIDLKKKQGVDLRMMSNELQLIRTMNIRRFEQPRQIRAEEKEVFSELCRNIVFIDFEDEMLPSSKKLVN